MKIPKKFKFMGKTWTVHFGGDLLYNTDRWGYTEFKQQEIHLDPTLTLEGAEQTFIHELLHIVFFEMNIMKTVGIDIDDEELLIEPLANGVYTLLKDGIIDVRKTKTPN